EIRGWLTSRCLEEQSRPCYRAFGPEGINFHGHVLLPRRNQNSAVAQDCVPLKGLDGLLQRDGDPATFFHQAARGERSRGRLGRGPASDSGTRPRVGVWCGVRAPCRAWPHKVRASRGEKPPESDDGNPDQQLDQGKASAIAPSSVYPRHG